MRLPITLFLAICLAGAVLGVAAVAADITRTPCPHCQSMGGQCMKEVVEHRCRMVEVITPIKKTVYECKEVPYCLHKLPLPGHDHCCPECEACPRYKRVLIKKEVVCGEKIETKCVVEEIVHKVPCCEHCQAQLDDLPESTPAAPAAPPAVRVETPRLASPMIRIERSLQ